MTTEKLKWLGLVGIGSVIGIGALLWHNPDPSSFEWGLVISIVVTALFLAVGIIGGKDMAWLDAEEEEPAPEPRPQHHPILVILTPALNAAIVWIKQAQVEARPGGPYTKIIIRPQDAQGIRGQTVIDIQPWDGCFIDDYFEARMQLIKNNCLLVSATT